MIYKMLANMKQEYMQDILEYMTERYLDSGRAHDRRTAELFAQSEYDVASDEDIIEALEEIGVLPTLEY